MQETNVTIVHGTHELMAQVAEAVNKRKLVTVRTIDALDPIEGKDLIEVATIEGWKVVVKKGEFKIGDPCVYFEIDSFLPDGNPAWQFLVDKSSRTFEGQKGHKLRTIKMGGQVSQGLALPLRAVEYVDLIVNGQPEYETFDDTMGAVIASICEQQKHLAIRDIDFSALLGVKKYETPLPAELAGQAEGLFPFFMQKTDQERCQNLKAQIFGYEDVRVPFDVTLIPQEARDVMSAKGELVQLENGSHVKVLKATASPDDVYEITMKLDGSSMTAFGRLVNSRVEGVATMVYEDGVCSRNLQLKINEENASNTFVSTFVNSGLRKAIEAYVLETGHSIAVQGELMGPNIQGNREQFKDFKFFVFDIYDIDQGHYYPPFLRTNVFNRLKELGANIEHVPVIDPIVKLGELNLNSIEDLLNFAEGPSIKHPVREGLVFKRMDGQFSFKAISNVFLAKEKD